MSNTEAKYEALRSLLGAAGSRTPVDLPATLGIVCQAVGLSGCAVALDPYESEPESAGEEWAQQQLRTYVEHLWRQLAIDHQVESAFMQLTPDGETVSLFAYPLRDGQRIAGVVLGLARGRRNLALEEDFLLALVTALHWARTAGTAGDGEVTADALAEAVAKARQAAILETAIAVNHEVNNPLTAVLGNTQLLLLHAEGLDEQTRKRLQDIEKSALRIKDVTQRLLKIRPDQTTEYPGGLRMLDLSTSDDADQSSEPDAD